MLDFRDVVGVIRQPLMVLDATLKVEYVNPAFCAEFGVDHARETGRLLPDVGQGEWAQPVLIAKLEESLSSERNQQEFPIRIVRGDSVRHLAVNVNPTRGTNKLHLIVTFEDVTDRRAAAEGMLSSLATQQNSLRFTQAIVDTIQNPLLVLDTEHHVVAASRSFLRSFEVTSEQTVGLRLEELGNGQWDIAALRVLLDEILTKQADVENYLVEHDFPSIGRRVMRLNARKLIHPTSAAELVLLAIQDVTISERTERQIRLSEELLRVTISSIGDAVITTDAMSGISTMNPIAERLTGWTAEEARGQSIERVFQIVNEDSRDTVRNPLLQAIKEGIVVGLANHTILIARDGTETPIDDSAAPIRQIDGSIVGGVLVFRDISQRRAADNERRRLSSIVERSSDFVGSCDTKARPTYLNPAGRRLVGLPEAADVTSLHVREFFATEEQTFLESTVIPTVLKSGRWFGELALRHFQTGERIPVLYDLFRVDHPESGRPVEFAIVARDIREAKAIETSLRQSEEFNRSLMEGSTDCIKVLDVDGNLLHMNEPGQCVMEIDDFGPLCGQAWENLWPSESRTDIERSVAAAREGQATSFEAFCPTAKGAPRWWEVTVSPVRDSAFGGVVRLLAVSRNISDRLRVQNERQELLASLKTQDRRKDEFLATLAHELRNPLAPLRNGLQVLKLVDSGGKVLDEVRSIMERQLEQMVHLIDDLMDISRISQGKIQLRMHRLELQGILQRAAEISRPIIEEREHSLTTEIPVEPIYVEGDSTRLAQIFSNLLNNAAKYTERGGRITLRAAVANGMVTVFVEDNGVGIAPEMLPRVFDIFAQVEGTRNKAQGGLGIGLALVKNLVEMHGGTAAAESEGLGLGCVFRVSLPTSGEGEQPTASGDVADVRQGQPWRIVLADDNLDSASSLAMLLRFQGHDVHTANDGEEALRLALELQPDMMLLDIGMPKLTGYEVCRQVRARSWGESVTIIALTGWGQVEDLRESREAGFDHHLVKPVDPAVLIRVLAESDN